MYTDANRNELRQLANGLRVHLDVFRTAVTDITKVKQGFADHSNEKARALLAEIGPWGHMYDVPATELLMRTAQEFGLMPIAQEALTFRAEDASRARDKLHQIDPEITGNDEASRRRRFRVLATMVPMEGNFRSTVHYGLPLSDLIALGDAGSDGAFHQAVRIDPMVLGSATFAKRVTRATITGDRKFFRSIGNAMRLPPLGYSDVAYAELRFLLTFLEPAGVLKQLGVSGTYVLLAEEVGVYPTEGDTSGREGDQARSLWQFIARWRKDLSTKKRRRM